MTFDEIDENFVKKVQPYFEKDALQKSELLLSQKLKNILISISLKLHFETPSIMDI